MTARRTAFLHFSAIIVSLAIWGSARAETEVYTAVLNGASESPPVVSDGIGFGIITLDTEALTMRVQTGFSGLTGLVTVAHVHCCTLAPGAGTVGVATMTPSFPGFPAGVTEGQYDETFDMSEASSWNPAYVTNNGGGVMGALTALKFGLDSGSAFLNIHTNIAPAGEIRGFLQRGVAIFADSFEN